MEVPPCSPLRESLRGRGTACPHTAQTWGKYCSNVVKEHPLGLSLVTVGLRGRDDSVTVVVAPPSLPCGERVEGNMADVLSVTLWEQLPALGLHLVGYSSGGRNNLGGGRVSQPLWQQSLWGFLIAHGGEVQGCLLPAGPVPPASLCPSAVSSAMLSIFVLLPLSHPSNHLWALRLFLSLAFDVSDRHMVAGLSPSLLIHHPPFGMAAVPEGHLGLKGEMSPPFPRSCIFQACSL